jgi:hypothetical protein
MSQYGAGATKVDEESVLAQINSQCLLAKLRRENKKKSIRKRIYICKTGVLRSADFARARNLIFILG